MTEYFVVYDDTDLRVLATGACENGMVEAQACLPGMASRRLAGWLMPDDVEVRAADGGTIVIDRRSGQRIDR
jgi:hypothetical protein